MSNEFYPLDGRRIFVAGHRGMVGSALLRRLENAPCDVLTVERSQLDLTRQADVEDYMAQEKPDCIVIAAAKVGGILANSRFPADYLAENLAIGMNLVSSSHRLGVERLMFLGSSCIYPKLAPQPIPEDALLTAPLEPTNEAYAIAKITGVKLCDAYRAQYGRRYISVMPTNLYGPNDNFDETHGHVIPSLLRRFHIAKRDGAGEVVIWGSGSPRREFMHVDDLADALVFLLTRYDEPGPINVGTGQEISILELAHAIKDVVSFDGAITFDSSKPDGTPRKLMDSSRVTELGWASGIDLMDGLRTTYDWYRDTIES